VSGLRPERLTHFVPKQSAIRLDIEGAGDQSGRLHREALSALGRKSGSGEDPQVELRLSEGDATLWLDTSGEFLFRRGYRQEVSRAPLKESLAAGLLHLAGHDPRSPFLDALCGSGTLPIEAALLVRHRAPGMERVFSFEQFANFNAVAWEKRKAAARAQERSPIPGLIRASDLNAGSLGTARRNAKRAGVFEDLTLERQDVATLRRPPDSKPGLWLSNLPYGKRLTGDLALLYRAVGETWKRAFPDWTLGALVEDGALLEAAIGRPPSAQFPVAQGGLHCALWIWRP
jgi:putative N6-adenine-specific DNA methylase